MKQQVRVQVENEEPIGICDVCIRLHLSQRKGSQKKAMQLLEKHGVGWIGRTVRGRGYTYNWHAPHVDALWEKIKPKAPPPPVVAAQQPLQLAPAADVDEVVSVLVAKIEGQAAYIKRCGDEIAHLRVNVSMIEAQNRQLISAMNRLLIAAQLRPIPEVAANGATHTAPEKTQ